MFILLLNTYGVVLKTQIFLLLLFATHFTYAQISFDADFESGNLKSVATSDSINYYVETHSDIGGRWFYFRINGVKDKNIRVEVTTSPADFTRAMYSYDDKDYIRFSEIESPALGVFQKQFEQDTVYVAYYTPYTYKMLQENLNEWSLDAFVEVDTLGFTPNLFPIQEIIVTDPTVPDSEKLTVWIHARTHPGETPSSWHFEGIVKELLSDDEIINYYLSRIKFHLIPFVNPDGVYFGRSRTNFNYIDVESNWDKSELETSQEVKILRARMQELNDEQPFSVFLNLHSQASSYCTFWIHTAHSTSSSFYRREYQFGNLNISDNPYFLRYDFRESDLKAKYPEGWLWNNYGEQVMALTYETPYNNYFRDSNEPFIEVTNDNLFEIGRRTVYSVAEYLEISHPYRYIMDNTEATIVGNTQNYSSTTEFFGDDFIALETNSNNTYTLFESERLPSGNYDIAAWWPTSTGNSYETVFEITAGSKYYEETKTQKANGGQWNYLTSVELNSDGAISIKLQSNSTGLVVADAFRLIYNGPVSSVEKSVTPSDFVLYQNYPNPFNPSTTIRYSISNMSAGSEQNVSLIVFNLLGEIVATLVDEVQFSGEYEISFSPSTVSRKLSSGPYFYRLQVGESVKTKKMILMK